VDRVNAKGPSKETVRSGCAGKTHNDIHFSGKNSQRLIWFGGEGMTKKTGTNLDRGTKGGGGVSKRHSGNLMHSLSEEREDEGWGGSCISKRGVELLGERIICSRPFWKRNVNWVER